MKTIQTHALFYVELSPEEIRICPKHGISSVYPIWLGKNRAIMRDAIKTFEKEPPQTFIECIEMVSRLGLEGMGSHVETIPELFIDTEESLDDMKIFW